MALNGFRRWTEKIKKKMQGKKPANNQHEINHPVCIDCGHNYREGERYCRICGAPITGFKEYEPEKDRPINCIYGPPPVRRRHQCRNCGYTWETCLMIDNEKFCPMCGGEAPFVYDDDDITEVHILADSDDSTSDS